MSSRGASAQRLLDDPLLLEVFDEIRADLLHEWENTPENAIERREAAWRGIKGMERLKSKLRSIVDNAKIEAAREPR
jgi:hypothetical protein